jgi:hypothetical protein
MEIAHHEYGTVNIRRVFDQWQTFGEAAALAFLKLDLAGQVGQNAYNTYGVDHPQARNPMGMVFVRKTAA